MKKLILSIVAALLTIVGLSGIATMSPAYAYRCPDGSESGDGTISGCFEGVDIAENNSDLNAILGTVINVIIGIVGFIAVVMMILGGISFITSQGDAAKVTKAKNTILYGVVGLIVAMLAFAIVNFVLSNVFGNNKGGGSIGTGASTGPSTGNVVIESPAALMQ